MFGLVSRWGVGYDPPSPSLEPRMTVRLSMLVLAAPLASLSCSDPPPTPPRGAVEIRLSPPASSIPNIGTRTSCMAGTSGTYTYLLAKASTALTAQDRVRTGLIEHGHGLSVSCTVKSLGGTRYSINASISGVEANSLRVSTSVTLNGTLNTASAPSENVGQIAFFSPHTTNLRNIQNLPSCSIGPVYVAKDGALLADFNCPVIADSSDTIKGCQASGTIAVERCRTGKEED
jgi:hypothetical protein